MKLGNRMTKQKRIILDLLKNTTSHPTADWVYEQAKKILPEISLGTVYRNLHLLNQLGEISVLNYGSSYCRYDGNPSNHYHFVCESCGRVFDVDLPVQEQLEKEVTAQSGFKILKHRLEFYGYCSSCQARNPN